MLSIIGVLLSALPGLASSVGEYLAKKNDAGVLVAHDYLASVAENNRAKADMRRAEGAWGPMGILMMVVGLVFATHAAGVVFDSMPLFGHKVGSWGVVVLPGMFVETEHAILQSLFPVGGGLIAVATLARVFSKR